MNAATELGFQGSASGLIVDFPSSSCRSNNGFTKMVRFSEISELRLFKFKKPSDEDKKKKSYTKQDYFLFQRERLQDVIRCSELFMRASNSGNQVNLSIEDSCLCIGLEFMMAPDVEERMKRIQKKRKRHVKRVLDEQALGRKRNEIDQDSIARVARKSSFDARSHATTVAAAAFSVTV
jgi:hypothetical protein